MATEGNTEGFKGIKENQLIYILLKAIQELNSEVKELKEQKIKML